MFFNRKERFQHVLLTGTMALVFLFILFSRMDLGMSVCLCHKAAVDQPRFFIRPPDPHLRIRGDHSPLDHPSGAGEHPAHLPVRDGRRNRFRILYRGGDGADIPCQILGLQQQSL